MFSEDILSVSPGGRPGPIRGIGGLSFASACASAALVYVPKPLQQVAAICGYLRLSAPICT
jgi:hypothetical protein